MVPRSNKLVASQLLLVAGWLLTGVGVIEAKVVSTSRIYLSLVGVVLVLLGYIVLRQEVTQSKQKLSKKSVAGRVAQGNVAKLVLGLSLVVSGVIMAIVGLIAGFASEKTWFYLCLIGLLAAGFGGSLMQSEIRRIIRTLR